MILHEDRGDYQLLLSSFLSLLKSFSGIQIKEIGRETQDVQDLGKPMSYLLVNHRVEGVNLKRIKSPVRQSVVVLAVLRFPELIDWYICFQKKDTGCVDIVTC